MYEIDHLQYFLSLRVLLLMQTYYPLSTNPYRRSYNNTIQQSDGGTQTYCSYLW